MRLLAFLLLLALPATVSAQCSSGSCNIRGFRLAPSMRILRSEPSYRRLTRGEPQRIQRPVRRLVTRRYWVLPRRRYR